MLPEILPTIALGVIFAIIVHLLSITSIWVYSLSALRSGDLFPGSVGHPPAGSTSYY
jgi:hypothetical protein